MATTAQLQPAYHHLQELRNRLTWCVAVLLAGGGVGYFARDAVIAVLRHPLSQQLYYTSPMGSFDFVMRVCFLVGFLAALPVIIYHLVRFVEPALPRSLSRRAVAGYILGSLGLMVAGVSFGYFVSLPTALHFFNSVGTGNLQAIITADQYFSFIITYLAIFAVVFQLPLILLFINRITPLGPTKLGRYRKWVVIGSFVVGLIAPITPDPMSQIILAAPIVVLYELSIVLLRVTNRRKSHRPAAAQPQAQVVAQTTTPAPRPVTAPRPAPAPRPVHAYQHPAAPTIDLRAVPVTPPRPVLAHNILDLRSA